jgi:pilus assembly protein CpaB
MNRKLFSSFALALGVAGLAGYIAYNWIQTTSAKPASTASQPVVVAAMQIPYASKIESAQVRYTDWPRNSLPEGSFSKLDDVVGRVVSRTVYPGEALLKDQLAEYHGGSTLSAFIQPKMRAITVRVDDVTGVGGFVLPGNHVDVLCPNKEKHTIDLVLQDVKVLAVDQEASPDKDKPAVVKAATLEMTPDQAETLVVAMQGAAVHLALRNPTDEALVNKPTPQIVAPTIKQPVVVAKREPRTVTIIRGSTLSIVPVN